MVVKPIISRTAFPLVGQVQRRLGVHVPVAARAGGGISYVPLVRFGSIADVNEKGGNGSKDKRRLFVTHEHQRGSPPRVVAESR